VIGHSGEGLANVLQAKGCFQGRLVSCAGRAEVMYSGRALCALFSFLRRANSRRAEQLPIAGCKRGHLGSCGGAQGACVRVHDRILCDETRTFSDLVDQDELLLQNLVSSMSNLTTKNNHAIATQPFHCSEMLNKDLACDETRTIRNLVDQDELRLISHHRSLSYL
jgi:hypothetical protein